MNTKPSGTSPYKGLVPYGSEDWNFFFGRDSEIDVICANLTAWRHTVVYGPSGVGKTSVLQAGALHHLRLRMAKDIESHWERIAIPVLCRNWQDQPVDTLLDAITREIANALPERAAGLSPRGARLADVLAHWTTELQCSFFLILDQFEEYFTYCETQDPNQEFIGAIASVIKSPALPVNVLISTREDQLFRLDVLQEILPELLQNSIRIEHLNPEAAREAILKPIDKYNSLLADPSQSVSVDEDLVKTVLKELQGRDVQAFFRSAGPASVMRPVDTGENRIQAPFLQLVMTRLWDEEVALRSRSLRRATLTKLRGSQEILASHLKRTLDNLSTDERTAAVAAFQYLVTPSGLKQAQATTDLAKYTHLPEDRLRAVMAKLAQQDFRILRPLPPPMNAPTLLRYEIFHDALAPAIFRYVEDREKAQLRRRGLIRSVGLVSIIVGMGVFAAVLHQYWRATWPWAYMTNLATGRATSFSGEMVSIGRSVERYYPNTVSLKPRNISRLHMLINKDRRAIDMRSINGTTINARFLPYGESQSLNDGDLVVLAGIAPFRFNQITYPWYALAPYEPANMEASPGWGTLIDGKNRTSYVLQSDAYFLYLDQDQKLAVAPNAVPNALLRFGVSEDGQIAVQDEDDGRTLWVDVKAGDYTYLSCEVPAGVAFKEFDPQELPCKILAAPDDHRESTRKEQSFKVSYHYGQHYFQIVSSYALKEP